MGAPVRTQHRFIYEGAKHITVSHYRRAFVPLLGQLAIYGRHLVHHLLVEALNCPEIRQPANPNDQPQQGCGCIRQAVVFQPSELELVIAKVAAGDAVLRLRFSKQQVTECTAAGMPAAIG